MLKLIVVLIIIFIVIQTLYENTLSEPNAIKLNSNVVISDIKLPKTILKTEDLSESSNIIKYNIHNPWSKVIINKNDEYPYFFYIKIKISSFNDYYNWKKIIPNLDFNASTSELVIPSKDEPSALALANLIIINFMGQIKLDEILDKNLIQISINKCKNFELVQTKIRDQINENLGNKNSVNNNNINYERDLNDMQKINRKKSQKINFNDRENIPNRIPENILEENNPKVIPDSITKSISENIENIIENSLENINKNTDTTISAFNEDPEPYDGSDYSYL
jgi:hypothetical protein